MFDRLKEMTGGDEDRIQIYINLYTSTLPEYSSAITRSLREDDKEQLRQAVHSCKTLFSTMGFDDLFKLAEELESNILAKGDDRIIHDKAITLNRDMMATLDQFS